MLNSSYTRCSQSSKWKFYLIASLRRLRAPNLLHGPQVANDQLLMGQINVPFLMREVFKEEFFYFFRQFTRVSNRDESNCSNGGESECPPIVDKSTIECPQIEALCLWLVYLRLRLPTCRPFVPV